MLVNKNLCVVIMVTMLWSILLVYPNKSYGQIYHDTNAVTTDTTLTTKRLVAPGDILISEILFNPTADGAEYVELYIASSQAVPLNQLCLARWNGERITRLYPLATTAIGQQGEYYVVTTDPVAVQSQYTVAYPSRLCSQESMPTYPNTSGTVMVTLADSTVIDRLDYTDAMHNPLLRTEKGIALERASMQRPTQDVDNWHSAASAVGYGTPTGPNSQALTTLVADNDIVTSGDLLSPDGDGYQDQWTLTYTLTQSGLVGNVTIYDAHRRLIRQLTHNLVLGTQGTLTWDGTNDNGQPCPRGRYLVFFEVYNTHGVKQIIRKYVNILY